MKDYGGLRVEPYYKRIFQMVQHYYQQILGLRVFSFCNYSNAARNLKQKRLKRCFLQRGRDHGLPNYHTARRNLGLKELTSFYEINPPLFDNQTHFSSPPDIQSENGLDVGLQRL